MAFYHIKIEWTHEYDGYKVGHDVDFEKHQVTEITNRIKKKLPIIFSGAKILPLTITGIRIWKTQEEIGNIAWNRIMSQGENVTKKFINYVPGALELIEDKLNTNGKNVTKQNRDIFIVHGRDEKPALELARIIENEFFLKAILLKEEPHAGNTIIEKLEEIPNIGYVFVLFTPDDIGGLKGENLNERVRQNVILEWGHFAAKLGRKKTCVLLKGQIEIPSDIRGIGYHRFHKSVEELFLKIKRELKRAEII